MNIKQFEIWKINFDPSIGNEIKKSRPALILSNNYYNIASGTIFVIPLTTTQPDDKNMAFFIKIKKNISNKLTKDSYANVSQFRAISKLRFLEKIGEFEKSILDDIIKKFLSILDIDIVKLNYFNF